MERRTFIVTSGATALQTQLAAGANDRVNIAVVAVYDIDNAQAERAVALVEKAQAPKPKSYQDYGSCLRIRRSMRCRWPPATIAASRMLLAIPTKSALTPPRP